MFLDFNSQKSWQAEVVVKASGSYSPRTSGGPRLRTTDLMDCSSILHYVLYLSGQRRRYAHLAFLVASDRRIFTATSRGRPLRTLNGNSRLGRSWGFSTSHKWTFWGEKKTQRITRGRERGMAGKEESHFSPPPDPSGANRRTAISPTPEVLKYNG